MQSKSCLENSPGNALWSWREKQNLTWSNHFIWSISLILYRFPGSSAGKESICNAGDPGSVPGLGRPPGERIG